MTIATLTLRKKPRLVVDSIVRGVQNLSSEFVTTYLTKYYKIYWSKKYFLQQSEANLIIHRDKVYHVEFNKPLTRGKILQMDDMDQLELSFRIVKPEYELPNTVLVSYPPAYI